MNELQIAVPSGLATLQNANLFFCFAGVEALTNFNFLFSDRAYVVPMTIADALMPYSNVGKEKAKEALDQMKKMGVALRAPDGGYYFDKESFFMPGKFVTISLEELKKFVSNRKNNAELFSFFALLLSTRSAESGFKAGYMPQTYLAEQFGVSLAGAMRYIKTLEELELLYVKRFPPSRLTGERLTNVYGRPSDKAAIDSWRVGGNSGVAVNAARRISAAYNTFVKKEGAGYSQQQILRLEQDCERYNAAVAAKGAGTPKDMSVFDRFAGENLRNDDFEDMFE